MHKRWVFKSMNLEFGHECWGLTGISVCVILFKSIKIKQKSGLNPIRQGFKCLPRWLCAQRRFPLNFPMVDIGTAKGGVFMKASDVLVAKSSAEKGTVFVSGILTNTITIVGSTVPISAETGCSVNGFTIRPEKSQGGFVAVVVKTYRFDKKYGSSLSFFLPVGWEDKPFVDLEEPWIPSDRLGQIVYSHLEVRVGDQVFTTNSYDKDKPGYRYIADGNLLCRYLNYQAEVEGLEAATSEVVGEETIRTKVAKLEKELVKQLEDSISADSDSKARINQLLQELGEWRSAAIALKAASQKPWWQRGRYIKSALRHPRFK